MPSIRQLPPSLVNKIAAGEVIERPASVVKELLENSIDAGATEIEVAIEGGGLERIRISDNGCGIAADQIALAVASHATSKLESADDLFDVHTLGFRGEALASIAEVSHLTLRTRTADSQSGAELSVEGGQSQALQPAGCPTGTTIEVRNLFFNTPVRRKFLRTPQTEAGHITEAFTRIALAFPQVRMVLTSGNRTLFELPATEAWSERIRGFFGDELSDALIPVHDEQDQARLSGYVADPSVSRGNNRMQYLFLNGRYIRDRSLQHALGEAYRGLLMVGRFPVCFLRLVLPANRVDVNVHPTKMEVRFQDGGKIYSQLLQTLRHQFLSTDLTARGRHVPGPLPHGLQGRGNVPTESTDSVRPADPTDQRWSAHGQQMAHTAASSSAMRGLNLTADVPVFRPFETPRGAAGWQVAPTPANSPSDWSTEVGTPRGPGVGLPVSPSSPQAGDSIESNMAPPDPAPDGIQRVDPGSPVGGPPPAPSHLGFQVHNRYLVTQDESGMVVVDQHALHERILYEQLRTKTDAKQLESQRLLVPEPVDLSSAEAAAAIEYRELLAQIGIEIEPFGGDTLLITSYPAMLANMRPAEVLRQVLEPLMAGGREPSPRDVLDELLHMLACKAAIKAGDRLSADEITALLEQRYHYQDTHHCPHGRPTALFFSRDQLDRMFKRT